MGKQKQQILSHFFSPKPISPSSSSSSPTPKISATVTFSPSKRLKLSPHHHSHNPISSLSNPSLHKRFLDKFLEEPLQNPVKPFNGSLKYTPLELQVLDLKKNYPDVLLMVEVGYKFRFFGNDAEIAARVLGIYAHLDHNFVTASIPTFRLNVHVRRLVSAGYKVGVVKQTETAAIKAHGLNKLGPFCRGLSALYTKATLEAAQSLGEGEEEYGRESNYLFCVVERSVIMEGNGVDVKMGAVAVEISTGDVVYGEFNDNFMRSGLEAMLLSLSPAELLLGEPISKQTEKLLLGYAGPASNVRVEHVSRDCFKDSSALTEVLSLFENIDQDNLADHQKPDSELIDKKTDHLAIKGIMNMPDLALQALALIIRHLKQFGFERIVSLGSSFRSFSCKMEMTLSANTLKQLEVLTNNDDGSETGSLLQSMNHTLTIFGSRLFRHWITHPLCDRDMITARQEAVSEIAESMASLKVSQNTRGLDEEDSELMVIQPELNYILSSVLSTLGRAPDIQRGVTRIFHRTAAPSEFIAVIQAILSAGKQLQQLHIDEEDDKNSRGSTIRSKLLRKLILTAASPSLINIAAKLLSTLSKEAADKGDLSNLIIINNDQFPKVARARKGAQSAREKLDSLIGLYRKQLGMWKLEFTTVSGTTHLIELAVDVKVPSTWVKVNSTKKTIRYQPPEVLSALDQLSLVNEELIVASREAWDSFLSGFSKYYAEFQAAVQALASIDCLHSMAILSRNKKYARPEFVYDDEPGQIFICSGRHPVLETTLQGNFVPNDTNLHMHEEHCLIVTGPNMGGKSCYIRQVALIAIMAQVGSFVPASSARLHVLDGIYTRIGASDSIQQGRSTFLEEMSETSNILHHCTSRSLVIIDELGRGTSTHDGVAIAYATLHNLLKEKKCLVLFVTHYPKVADIRKEFPGSVGVYHVSYLTSHKSPSFSGLSSDDEDVTYLYKLVPGIAERSFGFKVAQLAQLPLSCIARATEMGAWLEATVAERVENKSGEEHLQEASRYKLEETQCFFEDDDESEERMNAYKEFFPSLKAAICVEDVEKSSHHFNQARSMAKELLGR